MKNHYARPSLNWGDAVAIAALGASIVLAITSPEWRLVGAGFGSGVAFSLIVAGIMEAQR